MKSGSPAAGGAGPEASAPPNSNRRRKLLVRTATGGGLAAAVAALVMLADRLDSSLPVLVVGALLAGFNAIELVRMPVTGRAISPGSALAALAAAVYAVHSGLVGDTPRGAQGLLWLAAVVPAALFVQAVAARASRRDAKQPDGQPRYSVSAHSLWLAAWACAPLPALAWIHLDHGTRGLVALIVLSKVGDIAGYYVGSAIGKHHPFKRLSPGKTTEGCLGSLVAGGLVGAIMGAAGGLPGEAGVGVGLVVGLSMNLAAQAGDLLESFVKRRSGVKDSSAWLGASGGFLDVTDSLLLTVPLALASWGSLLG